MIKLFPIIQDICYWHSLRTFEAYITNNLNPDETAPQRQSYYDL